MELQGNRIFFLNKKNLCFNNYQLMSLTCMIWSGCMQIRLIIKDPFLRRVWHASVSKHLKRTTFLVFNPFALLNFRYAPVADSSVLYKLTNKAWKGKKSILLALNEIFTRIKMFSWQFDLHKSVSYYAYQCHLSVILWITPFLLLLLKKIIFL